jgi:hypothetical protein
MSAVKADAHTVVIALAIHDATYLLDFSVEHINLDDATEHGHDLIAERIIKQVEAYEHENFVKFIGAGISPELEKVSGTLCSRLWLELDVVPLVLNPDSDSGHFWEQKSVDEQADSMARKCIM